MKKAIAKYFWSLNDQALAETEKALGDPDNPIFVRRAITLLSRCDDPEELFAVIPKAIFVNQWASIRRQWKKSGVNPDHRAWWDAIYRSIVSPDEDFQGEAASRHLRYIGSQIKTARKKKEWTQAELAERVGMGQKEISEIENGKSNITLLTLIKLAKTLEVKSADLYADK